MFSKFGVNSVLKEIGLDFQLDALGYILFHLE